jgi:ParB family chromosome partitioning protein
MTSTTTQTTTTTQAAPASVPDGVEFAHVDPRTLTIEANVRSRADLDPAFLASIATYGVRQPIQAVRDASGTLTVRAGQRRTLGAIETGLLTIPVYILGATDSETARIFEQMDENDRRRALTDNDRANAFQQLTLLGVSAAQIAKQSHTKRKIVDAALTVTASPLAAAVLAEHDLTLDQAVVLAEFDDDPALVAALTVVAVKEPAQFAHTAQRLRDERAVAEARDALTAELATAGVVVVDRPDYDAKTTNLTSLRDAAGNHLDAEAHATCPGRAAYIAAGYGGQAPRAVHVCLDPKAHGHASTTSSGSPAAGGPMSEEQKADRRAVIAGNAAWRSAETVRRSWLRTFAARKTTPKDAPALLAYAVTTCNTDLTHAAQSGHTLARTTLGLPAVKPNGYGAFVGGQSAITSAIDAASPARAQLIGLVVVLAAIEARTGTHTWRNPCDTIARYLRALAAWGYNLAEIEQSAIDRYDDATTTAPDTDQDDTGDEIDDDYYACDDDEFSGAELAGEEAQAASDAQE